MKSQYVDDTVETDQPNSGDLLRSSVANTKKPTTPEDDQSPQGHHALEGLVSSTFLPVWMIVFLGVGVSVSFAVITMRNSQNYGRKQFDKAALLIYRNLESERTVLEISSMWIHQACKGDGDKDPEDGSRSCTYEEFNDLKPYFLESGLKFDQFGYVPRVLHKNRARMEAETNQTNQAATLTAGTSVGTSWSPQSPVPTTTPVYRGFQTFDRNFSLVSAPESEEYLPVHYSEPRGRYSDLEISRTPNGLRVAEAMRTFQPQLAITRINVRHQAVSYIHPGLPTKEQQESGSSSQAVSMVTLEVFQFIQSAIGYEFIVADIFIEDITDSDAAPFYLAGASVRRRNGEADATFAHIEKAQFEERDLSSRSSRKLRKPNLHTVHTLNFAGNVWRITIVSDDDAFLPPRGLITTSAGLVMFACVVLAGCFWTRINRARDLQVMEENAATEKAALLVENAEKNAMIERELNDYVAHEVRNPLAAALSACSFVHASVNEPTPLQTESKIEEVRDDIAMVASSLHFINDLLRSMLDLHMACSRKLQLEVRPTDILHDVLQPVSSLIYCRGLDFDVVVECPENLVVNVDPLRLKQVVLNLANNSRKFVQRGFIRLTGEMRNLQNRDAIVRIAIEDTGPGIPEERRKNLFVKFQKSLDVLSQGTGIGLCLSKNLVDLMKGSLELDSSYHSGVDDCPGARFIIDLPVDHLDAMESSETTGDEHNIAFDLSGGQPSEDATAGGAEPALTRQTALLTDSHRVGEVVVSTPERDIASEAMEEPKNVASWRDEAASQAKDAQDSNPASEKLSALPEHGRCFDQLPAKLSVIIVDDDTIVRKLFRRSIRRVLPKWQVAEASNGETSLHMVEADHFDLVFMDQYMASTEKQLLGTETVQALRARGYVGLVCGLSANDMERQFIEAGANAFMRKPFPCEPQALCTELTRILQVVEAATVTT